MIVVYVDEYDIKKLMEEGKLNFTMASGELVKIEFAFLHPHINEIYIPNYHKSPTNARPSSQTTKGSQQSKADCPWHDDCETCGRKDICPFPEIEQSKADCPPNRMKVLDKKECPKCGQDTFQLRETAVGEEWICDNCGG